MNEKKKRKELATNQLSRTYWRSNDRTSMPVCVYKFEIINWLVM